MINKELRIKKEVTRVTAIFKDLPKKEKSVIDGLIKRSAYMRVILEDMELDLDTNGYVELFSQSDKTPPYERERPIARLYNTMNKNYQSINKQLADFINKEPPKVIDDGFDAFVASRDK